MSATLEELWPGVEAAAPDNPGPLLVFADYMDEHALAESDRALAYAMRWCAGHRKRPWLRHDLVRKRYGWYQSGRGGPMYLSARERVRRASAFLPAILWDQTGVPKSAGALPRCWSLWRDSFAAYRALAVSLALMREAVEVPSIVLPPAPQIVATGPVACAACGIVRARTVLDCPVCKSSEVTP